MTIGQRIKQLRTERGLSQDELAKSVGYKTRSAINKIELDERDVKHSQILSFAKALGTTPNYLMGWTEDPNEPFGKQEAKENKLKPAEQTALELFRQLTLLEQGEMIGRMRTIIEKREDSISKDA